MNLPPLPDIDPHDHPEPRAYKWTATEIAWIKRYASTHGEACRKQGCIHDAEWIGRRTQAAYEQGRKQALEEAADIDFRHVVGLSSDQAYACSEAVRRLIK